MTDNEIIKALECLTGEPKLCKDCPYNNTERYPFCREGCAKDALDLIQRQQERIKRLKDNLDAVLKEKAGHTEAVKEFAKRLKEEMLKSKYTITVSPYSRACNAVLDFWIEEIDNFVKRNGERQINDYSKKTKG